MLDSQLLYFRGRVALKELLIASGVGKDDKVGIQAYTCSAVPEGVFAANAKPIYIDVLERGVTMCPDDLETKLKINKDVKALVIQHTFGIVADLQRIIKIAKKYNLIIIEDCCHTINSEYDGSKVGSLSDASFYSFEWGKPISLGLGGAVRVNNQQILEKLKEQYSLLTSPPFLTELQLFIQRIAFYTLYNPRTYWTVKALYRFFSKYGIIKGNHTANVFQRSNEFDYKISRILKNKLTKKLTNLNKIEFITQSTAADLNQNLIELGGEQIIETFPESKPVYVRYPVWVSNKDNIIALAYENRIEVSDWYLTPVHPYKDDSLTSIGYIHGSCPNAELSCKHIVSLPLSHRLNESFFKKLKSILVNL